MARRDFDHDGSSDILWRNAATGGLGRWDMDHGAATWVPMGRIDLAWTVVGSGDLLGDGIPDILWDRTGPTVTTPGPPFTATTRIDHLAYWDMTGGATGTYHDLMDYTAAAALLGLGASTQGPPAQDGLDFTGDGLADPLLAGTSYFRNPIHGVTATINIATLSSADAAQVTNSLSSGTWSFGVAGDVNGDGTADILWRQGSFGAGVWIMRNGNPVGWVDVGSTDIAYGSTPIAVGDFTGAGRQDVLWWNIYSHQTGFWQFDGSGAALTAHWTEFGIVQGSWGFASVGDYNGDGTDDILWRDGATGEAGYWALRDGHIAAWHSLGTVPSDWQVT